MRTERFSTCEILQNIRARQLAQEAIKQMHEYAESHPGCVIIHDEMVMLAPNRPENERWIPQPNHHGRQSA